MTDDAIIRNALQSFFDNMPAFIYLKDTQNRLVRVNRRVADSHGLTPEDMAGRPLSDFYGKQAESYFEDDEEVIRSGKPKLNVIEPMPISGGNVKWVETSRIPVSDDAGAVVGTLAIAIDVTEKRETEQALAENQSVLRTVVDNLPEPLALYGPDRRLKFANPAFWNAHVYFGTRDVVKIGARFEDILEAVYQRATERGEIQDPQVEIDRILENYQNAQGSLEVKLRDRWYRNYRCRTSNDGRLVFLFNITEAKKAGQELAESQNLLHTVVETFSEMLAFYGPDDRLKFGNQAYWRSHETAGTADAVRIGATYEENARALGKRLSEQGKTVDSQFIVDEILRLHRDPSTEIELRWGERDIRFRKYPTPDGASVVLGYDVTEQNKAEKALKTSNERLRDFAESASDWFWEMDADLRFTWMSPKIAELTGVPESRHYGRPRSDLVDTDFDPEAWAAHQKTIEDRKPFKNFVYKRNVHALPDSTPSMIWNRTDGLPVFADDGTFMGYRGTASDVTKEMLAEQALRDSEERYQTLSKLAPVGIFRTSLEGRCTYTNDLWHVITDTPLEHVTTRCWTEVLHPEDRSKVADTWQKTAVDLGTFNAECRIASKHREDVWVLVTITVERGHDRTPCGFVGTLTDISRLKKVESQLRSTEQELREHRDQLSIIVEQRTNALRDAQQSLLLKERLAAIGQLTATVSHELRNPLGTITTSFAALKRTVDLSGEKANRVSARIERNLRRCESIIDDLLSHTRIDTLSCEAVDLDIWMAQTLYELDLPGDISLRTQLEARQKASIDPRLMRQALANVVSNAIDAMKDVSASEGVLDVETRQSNAGFEILVRDNGPGLDPSNLDRVFEPLISTKTFGIGLGLPLVRQIVELHGGCVVIRNRETQGAEVQMTLPKTAH